jgi:prevent-host-death family protein
MIKLNIHEIKNQLSKYIELVEAGATVVVCKRNVPVAEIRPIEHKKKRMPKLGWAEGRSVPPKSFHESMSKEDLRLWEGDEDDPLRKYAPKRTRLKK